MTFKEIATALGIKEYPAELNEIYDKMPQMDIPACEIEIIDNLQEKYNFFGDLYDIVRENAIAVNSDVIRSTWIKVATAYAKQVDAKTAKTIPVPPSDGTVLTQMLPYYIIIPQIPDAIEKYLSCGFREDEVLELFSSFRGSLAKVESLTGIIGLNQTYYGWLTNFTKAIIFRTKGFQFEIKNFGTYVLYLRNRESGQLLPLMLKGLLCTDGKHHVGSCGYENEVGAFAPKFFEDEENYYGHCVLDNAVNSKMGAYSKSQWECIIRPGDDCLSIHIPSGTDISPDATMRACRSAIKIMKKMCPEKVIRVIFCGSWLLNPRLKDMLGENSRITQFMECFTKYPILDDSADAVFTFVFSGRPDNLADLPENTTLHRKLKKLYIDGDCLHKYSGIIYVGDETQK